MSVSNMKRNDLKMDVYELFLRVFLSYVVLFILTRIMGRKEISQMTFFNFVSAISIGSIAAALVVNNNVSIRNGILALVGWTIITLILEFLDIKSFTARKLIVGEPVVVIHKGKIMDNGMQKTRLVIGELIAMLRQKNIFSIQDVDYAIIEPSGRLSVKLKYDNLPVTKRDLNVSNAPSHNYSPDTTGVIFDGKVNKTNLENLNLNERWLKTQLQQQGVQSAKEVFYAEVQNDGTLYIDKKDDQIH
ncbi:YetF domain-containing protein [Salirhabdus salicampi]|uniref:YetF domain-containing protein n=1 Tax=Salirhabdus salicampi TaxID=476102 RepID=UPI0020C2108A|nr:DUF421 domain-containing protein [Salirhabdus salicampi]MCP8616234.1 DUF421 domain-containing protein [Salirhabdus salicampi]